MARLRRKPYGVKLPDQPFVIVMDADPESWEGPYDPRYAEVQDDGAVALLSDGLPVVLRVKAQAADRLTLDDGAVVQLRLAAEYLTPPSA